MAVWFSALHAGRASLPGRFSGSQRPSKSQGSSAAGRVSLEDILLMRKWTCLLTSITKCRFEIWTLGTSITSKNLRIEFWTNVRQPLFFRHCFFLGHLSSSSEHGMWGWTDTAIPMCVHVLAQSTGTNVTTSLTRRHIWTNYGRM
jgi:hypothetical protein